MRLMRCGLVLAFACAGIVAATAQSPAGGVQPPPPPPPAGQRGAQPPAPGGRGGGRGRGAIQVMTLTSTAFADGAKIPAKYTQAGEEASPPLAWSGAPEGTASFVVMMHDVDTAIPAGQRRHASLDAVEHSADGDELARARGRRLAARRRNAADQRHRSGLQGSGRGCFGAGASLRFRALRARHDARGPRGRRVTTTHSCGDRGRDGDSRPSKGGAGRTLQARLRNAGGGGGAEHMLLGEPLDGAGNRRSGSWVQERRGP